MIEANAYMKPGPRKSGRGGRSLLAGLLRCRRCGHTLQVSYGGRASRRPSFRCTRRHLQAGQRRACPFAGTAVEAAVSAQILAGDRADGHRRRNRSRAAGARPPSRAARGAPLELEQARYDARLAARRYEQVDPANGLSRRNWKRAGMARSNASSELDRAWRTSMHAHGPAAPGRCPRLQALAHDVPALWHDPATDMRLKQRIVRILIHEIIADVDDAAHEIVLVIHWQGGRHTDVRVPGPRAAARSVYRCRGDRAGAPHGRSLAR